MTTIDTAYIKAKVREHWNARAPMLDVPPYHIAKTEEEDQAWHELLARHFPAGSPLRVLDIGTGHGYLAGVAANLGHEAVGIDIAEEMVERARARAETLGLTIDLRVADADQLPFDGGSFDAITERNVLWTMPDPSATLAEFLRVLRPGGRLLVIESKWLEQKTDHVTSAQGGAPNLDEHYHEFRADLPLMGGATGESMRALLEAHGFVEAVIDPLEAIHAARVKHFPEMELAPERRQYLVRAQRPEDS